MEEKILIKGIPTYDETTYKKNLRTFISLIVLFSLLVIACICLSLGGEEEFLAALPFMILCILGIILLSIVIKVSKNNLNVELVITNKRAYGNLKNTRLDLPIHKISSVGINKQYLSMRTDSGTLLFHIKNKAEVHEVISNLLIKECDMNSSSINNADELKKYKDLLDSGVITQEEFEAMKKKILGL